MKSKWRLVFIATVVFVFYVSYKILEPELSGNRTHEEEIDLNGVVKNDDDEPVAEHRSVDLKPALIVANGQHVKPDMEEPSVDMVIKSLADKFTPLYTHETSNSPWDVAAGWVQPREIHPQNSLELGSVLNAMIKGNVTFADFGHKGTQLKLTLVINHSQRIIFKPAWYPRDYVVTGPPYAGRDRHNAEIAAFHLGRILELRRTPLAVGRRFSFKKDILPVASRRLMTTFFERDGESCFYGKCLYCRGPEDGVCTSEGILEGTMILFIPKAFVMELHKHPWSRTYRDGVEPKWMNTDNYCKKVQSNSLFQEGPRLLDIIDTCIFDYLIGNADRHHYETFKSFPDSMLIILDNGKSFGNPSQDELTILAPLYQCCQVRASTWERLLSLQDRVLSKVLQKVLSQDPISPVLTQPHLDALDRRLVTILDQVSTCMTKHGLDTIVLEGSKP